LVGRALLFAGDRCGTRRRWPRGGRWASRSC